MLPAQSFLKLLQQHKPVAQNDDFLALVEPLNELAREHSFTGAGWRFQDKAAVLIDDRRELVDDILLPISKVHRGLYQECVKKT